MGQIGISLLITGLFMMWIFPSEVAEMPDGMNSPIIAYEMVRTEAEVRAMFNPDDRWNYPVLVKAMNKGNLLDFIFMALYCWFLFGFAAEIAKRFKAFRLHFVGACALVPVILFADLIENIQLLSINSLFVQESIEDQLAILQVSTWTKWFGLAACILLMAPYFLKEQGYVKVIGGLGILSAVLSIFAFIFRSFVIELFALSVTLTILLMVVYCYTVSLEKMGPADLKKARMQAGKI